MKRTVPRSRIGPDGVLHLTVPFGAEDANREVCVLLEPEATVALASAESWRQLLEETAGR